ncbi:MAG: hypothetical protein KJ614_06115 [Gammaproteobacteria bacterium]|uniref:hypothetical protein n=1 Tax=Rhodoferax sp. TaxID=50421 RepID=UPI00180FCEF4|nr:hypothetical protein [Rhodoferax sp.]MBU3898492.1 hypothetical protein [Gammaproteobacteria bacterium]MBA3058518.1 hypothetical protein [Rhodoferax sp.]MBU3997819.1 hypothetical protein [Gammaproteobacteria bacterium]MBU4079267.1 hypothetical protein [Gammaproteobacteria bacterium]MBU4112211.1 hypothetical protein [Gammaproteobacteria bacterium]
MELLILFVLLAFGAYLAKSREQGRRIALLGSYLGKYQIEKLMENLTDGYLRALSEPDPERQAQIWHMLDAAELTLCEQFNRFVAEFSSVDGAQTRVSRLPLALPWIAQFFPASSFDLRQALRIHAQGIEQAAQNSRQRTPKDKAFTLSAELFLMQHTCHWFCRSKMVASARMLMRHKTPYVQLLASVAPETRQAYGALVGA